MYDASAALLDAYATEDRSGLVDGGAKLLSVIVPTFNERDNVRELVARLDRCLEGIAWEVMFVDDDSRLRCFTTGDHSLGCASP